VVISDRKLLQELFRCEECSGRAPLFLTHGIMKECVANSYQKIFSQVKAGKIELPEKKIRF
jgi:hypothetical protein